MFSSHCENDVDTCMSKKFVFHVDEVKIKMPRKPKVLETIKETPVVFFLKLPELEEQQPYESTTYSEILDHPSYSQILEGSEKTEQRFNNDILKPILDSMKYTKYSENDSCFWCCHTFMGTQFHLPISYDTYKNVYTCKGNYCSPECALAFLYAEFNISDSTRWNKHVLLNTLYGPLYETGISPAPPRTMLRMFGGPLDIKQFRSYFAVNDLIHESYPPIRLVFPVMAIQGPLRDIKKIVSLSTDVIEKASESLRLKRSKPVNLNVPTLDLCIKN
jgi:hypothetical protein